jgi:hypothetical protein
MKRQNKRDTRERWSDKEGTRTKRRKFICIQGLLNSVADSELFLPDTDLASHSFASVTTR